ncbi:MAG TPA: DNA repair protein RecN [Jatrophihabitantaceae bacterium]|nr:DNA repair protein RecN [Jatrophihabitantaceae bacterium]
MLEELRIRGLGVIDDAVLPLGPGLTVVTGETGAGKTMVVSGLLLLFGGRADTARVRTGADQASVEGRLHVNDAVVTTRVEDAGGALDDGTDLTLRRVVSGAGRSRAFVGGASAPVSVLAELADNLVAVHGQTDQLRLTRRSEQVALLDRYGDIDTATYREAYERWRAAAAELADKLARLGELRREADLLEHGIAEIADADPQPGEDLELAVLAERLSHADALRAAARLAHDTLAGDPDDPASDAADAGTLLGAARKTLAQAADADPTLGGIATQLDELAVQAGELAAQLREYEAQLDADPARLAEVQERRTLLTGLIRKYGEPDASVASVLAWAEAAHGRLTQLDVSDQALAELTGRRDAAASETAQLADELSAQRRAAAAKLGAAVSAELAGLAMADAEFTVDVRPRAAAAATGALAASVGEIQAGADGADDVEFLLRPHPQAPAVPVAKGASGGELSRVMLALEVCLAGADPVPTMVFDEVDAGVGGRAAVEVGRRLAALGRDRQVLVVTHLAQVAAFADRHIAVGRAGAASDGVTASDVRLVTDDDRVTELARMLAGSDSDTAREHATELLEAAKREQTGR